MPLTPGGHGGPLNPANSTMALLLGGLAALGGLIVLISGVDLWGGLLISGFGLMMLTWGGLMSERVISPTINRLLLIVGLLSGALAFGSAVMLLR